MFVGAVWNADKNSVLHIRCIKPLFWEQHCVKGFCSQPAVAAGIPWSRYPGYDPSRALGAWERGSSVCLPLMSKIVPHSSSNKSESKHLTIPSQPFIKNSDL